VKGTNLYCGPDDGGGNDDDDDNDDVEVEIDGFPPEPE